MTLVRTVTTLLRPIAGTVHSATKLARMRRPAGTRPLGVELGSADPPLAHGGDEGIVVRASRRLR